ncbi:hypothetical protein PTI98_013340 [Pleurotus ostreatus]|nr:hypothetical protein PTI98_013340 [Pleurotus ostreatus]
MYEGGDGNPGVGDLPEVKNPYRVTLERIAVEGMKMIKESKEDFHARRIIKPAHKTVNTLYGPPTVLLPEPVRPITLRTEDEPELPNHSGKAYMTTASTAQDVAAISPGNLLLFLRIGSLIECSIDGDDE